jgi:hypothetical protein
MNHTAEHKEGCMLIVITLTKHDTESINIAIVVSSVRYGFIKEKN